MLRIAPALITATLVLTACAAPAAQPSEQAIQTAMAQTAAALPAAQETAFSQIDAGLAGDATAVPTVVPTAAPTMVLTTAAGLGISREDFLAMYQEGNLTVQQGASSDGQPRYVGTTSDANLTVEAIGAPDDLTMASVIVIMPKGNDEKTGEGMNHLLRWLQAGTPGWDGRFDWFKEYIGVAAQASQDGKDAEPAEKVLDDRQVKVGILENETQVITYLTIEVLP